MTKKETEKTDIETVREMFLGEDVDEETRADNIAKIAEWEEAIRTNKAFDQWQNSDISRSIVAQVKSAYREFGLQLAMNRQLTETQRITLWTKQDACIFLIELLEKDAKSVLARVDEEIKQAINVT